MSFGLSLSVIGLAAFAATAALTNLTRQALVKHAVMDHPNERSMHAVPVPRGGGLAVMLVVLGGLIASWHSALFLPPFLWIELAVLLLMIVSWMDDRHPVNAAWRFAAHVLAALMGSLALPQESFLFNGLVPLWAERVTIIVGWVWFINLYNFMDGIDGITGIETISIALGATLILNASATSDPFLLVLSALLAGACCGFLMFNWHPAKIFLGDVGSVPLGFLTGFLLLQLAAHGFRAAAIILPLYYLADSGFTLGKRLLHGEKFWRPHRQHFYQRAAQGAKCHDRVVLGLAATNVTLIASALLAILFPLTGASLAVLSVALLLYRMHKSASR